ncbi:MAG: MFS transporter [Firmicutes bacterium]|nr:MFS transporter [Bacillota bacterium]
MKYKNRWRALFFIYIFMLVFAVSFQCIPPVLGFIVSSLKISHAQAGALMSFFALPGIFLSIPGGILADVYGSKRAGTAALTIVLLGTLLVGLGGSFFLLATGRVIAGIGALMIAVVAPQAISRWFANRDLGKAMGIYNTAMPLGTIFTLNMFGRLAASSHWRTPILLVVAYSVLVLLLFYFRYPALPGKEKQRSHEKPDFKKSVHAIGKIGWPIWLVAIIWMMYNASAISFLTFAGDYYTSVGYDISYAGFLASLLMIGSLIFSPLVGSLTDRVGKEELFIVGGCTVLAILLFLVPRTGLNPLLLGGLIGFFAPFTPAPVFSLVPKVVPAEQTGLGYGISSTCLNVGVLVGPLLVGFFFDWTQSYLPGFNLMAVFALIGAAVALLLWFVNQSAKA